MDHYGSLYHDIANYKAWGFSTPTFRDHEAKATRDRLGKPVPRRLVVVAALRSETPALWDPLGIKCGHGQFLINGGGTGWYMEKT